MVKHQVGATKNTDSGRELTNCNKMLIKKIKKIYIYRRCTEQSQYPVCKQINQVGLQSPEDLSPFSIHIYVNIYNIMFTSIGIPKSILHFVSFSGF